MMSEGVNQGEQLDFSAITTIPDESALLKQKIEAALAASKRAEERREAVDGRARKRPTPRHVATGEEASSEDDTREIPPALSIAQFYGRVRQVLLAEFADDIWIVGEIRSIRESKGHHYIELADEGTERKTAAQLEVACWAREWPRVRAQLAEARVSLEPGRVVRVRGRVSIGRAVARFASP